MGQYPYHLIATTFSTDTTGFDAIGVSLLGRTTAVGVLLGALLFGGLREGATQMQLNANVPVDLVYIIQALVLFSIASEFLPRLQRFLPNWARSSTRPVLAANITGTTMTDLPEETTASITNGTSPANGATAPVDGTSPANGAVITDRHSEHGEKE
jgi:simple sugar transport system permease protein